MIPFKGRRSFSPAKARILICALLFLLGPAPLPLPAQESEDHDDRAHWLAVFEQSYGSEGLYVVEVRPTDPDGRTRLDLQILNAAARQFIAENPELPVTYRAVTRLLADSDFRGPEEGEEYIWEEEKRLFTSSLGGNRTPEFGATALLRGNDAIRRRILNPEEITRSRWRRIYQDPEAPGFLKREIELREFMLENYEFRDARRAEDLRAYLERLEDAIRLYALHEQIEIGDEFTLEEMDAAGFFQMAGEYPRNFELHVSVIGEPPFVEFKDHRITPDPASVHAVRQERAVEMWRRYPDYPPTLALRARFESPDRAVELLNKAVEEWPEVHGLRVERMAHQARRGDFSAWTIDMDHIFQNFPAAPILIEMQLLAEVGGIAEGGAEAQFALLLADVRPDLLTHQIYALSVLTDSGQLDEARTVYDRLVFSNPAWGAIFPVPGSEEQSAAD